MGFIYVFDFTDFGGRILLAWLLVVCFPLEICFSLVLGFFFEDVATAAVVTAAAAATTAAEDDAAGVACCFPVYLLL